MATLTRLMEKRRSVPDFVKQVAVVVVALLLARWWALDYVPMHFRNLWGPYFWGPLGWTLAGVAALYIYRKQKTDSFVAPASVERATILTFAAMVGIFIVSTQILLAMFADFGKSPLAHSPKWLLINIFFAGSTLLAVESARAVLLRALAPRSLTLALMLTSVLLVAVKLPEAQFFKDGLPDQAKFWGSVFIPMAATGLVAGFFVLYGGIKAGLLVSAPIVFFQYLSPILPVADWPLMALAGVAGPAIGLWIAEGLFGEEEEETEEVAGKRGFVALPSVAWAVTGTFALIIFWFNFGFFGYKPMFVPSTSMEPSILRGDVVLLGPIDPDKVKAGDVVLYGDGRARILHRVIDIKNPPKAPAAAKPVAKGQNTQRTFVFKGDNNNTEDGVPVHDKHLMGTYKGRLPKIGWLPIKVQSELSKLR